MSRLRQYKRHIIFVVVVVAVILAVIFHNFLFDQVRYWWRNAMSWGVNPWIFIALLFATLYHYYKGWWQIGKGVITRNKELLLKGIALNRFVWAIPYFYVLIFGHGYPWWVPAGIVTWMAFGIIMFVRNYRRKEYVERMNNSLVGRFVGKLADRKNSEPKESEKEGTPVNFWRLQGWLYEALFALVPHRNLVSETAASVRKTPGRVLDAGCGTGRLSKYAQREIFGIDFSDTMLRVARKRGNKLIQADLCGSWPFADSSFVLVVSLNVLYALTDPKAMLAEAFRVLGPGGELKVASPTSEQLMPLVREHFKLATPTELLISMLNIPRFIAWGLNLTIRRLFDNSEFHFYSEDELVEMCEDVGFKVQSVIPCYAGIDAMIVARKR